MPKTAESVRLALTAEEIERRRLLWWALSDLMLDTDMPHVWGPHIARVMREDGWTLAEAHTIFLHEVGPAFLFNLRSVAGEWAGWDEEFVVRAVLAPLQRSRWLRWIDAQPSPGQLQAVWEHTLPYVKKALNENASEVPGAEASSRSS